MIQGDITPDEPIFNLIMDSSADLENFKMGLSVYAIMKKCAVSPNQVTFGTLVKLYGFANMAEEAFRLLDEMRKLSIIPSLIVYTNLMHISFRCERPDLAEKSFMLMTKQGVKGDHVCFSKLITGFQELKLYKKAFSYAVKAFESGSYVRKDVLVRLRGALGNTRSKKYQEEVAQINQYISQVRDEENVLKEIKPSSNYMGKNYD